MKNKLLSVICSIAFIFTFIPFGAFQIVANATLFKGSGTASDPYQIATADDLFKLAELINDEDTNPKYRYCYYQQIADIDLNNELFTPIGIFYGADGETLTANALFAGSYDGNYHTITNLKVEYSMGYSGLFGRIGQASYDNSNCIIKNLSVERNKLSSGKISGGIIGEIGYGATVSNCSFHGVVNGDSSVGGIAGNVQCGGNILNSYCNANVIGNNDDSVVGGIVGVIKVGNNTSVGSSDMVLKNCYMAGELEGTTKGKICGKSIIYDKREKSTISYNNNYFLLSYEGEGSVNGEYAVGCTGFGSDALKACADMLGSPFVDNSEENFNDGYPIFEWQSTPYQFNGSGTENDPYQISSKHELETMRDLVNSTYFNPTYGHAYYIQTSDIDLENESWIPIGLGRDGNDGRGAYNCTTRMFFGNYNGNQHNIENLNVNTKWVYSGLFGVVRGSGSEVSNLVVSGNISDGDYSGGITGGTHYFAKIINCAFIGGVKGEKDVGGICGNMYAGGEILNCYHNGSVASDNYAGGITGRINFGEYGSDGDLSMVENCYQANGTVNGTKYAGSIVGICQFNTDINNSALINNCYANSNVGADVQSKTATSDNTLLLPKSLLKKIAEDLGEAYVDNADSTLNNGYPVFSWQLEKNIGLMGDVNNDGEFNVSDAVLFQKWLLAVKNVEIANWKAADFYDDDRLDVFDFCLMRKALVEQNS